MEQENSLGIETLCTKLGGKLMELMDAIKARKSSRSFLDKVIPEAVIDEMLEGLV